MRESWEPTASIHVLKERAQLFQKLRSFFYSRNILEIDVPVITEQPVPDIHLESIPVLLEMFGKTYPFSLITSPEYYLKRLLAAGSGSIYSLGKAFRQGEMGRRHQSEFTLLEWYRVGWDEKKLIEEVVELLLVIFPKLPVKKISYGELFQQVLDCNPHRGEIGRLEELVCIHTSHKNGGLSGSEMLDLLFSHCVEPTLSDLTVVYDYPACQCAMARVELNTKGEQVARRFEVFVDNLEVGNGYFELADAQEQRLRFEADIRQREDNRQVVPAIDEKLMMALAQGLPDCAGVALGVDRLLMKLLNFDDIEQVLAFSLKAPQA